ncbi:MAG: hypothetical protein C0483_21375 [Pirellula sp.]|nr:hypothetical protein [Pirellula sp.]
MSATVFAAASLETTSGLLIRADEANLKKPEFIQPDYEQWRQLAIGMKRDDVLKLLGDPLERGDHSPRMPKPGSEFAKSWAYSWKYGHLDFAHSSVPMPFEFNVGINLETQLVIFVHDPFGGRLSKDGSPTAPQLVTPHEKSKWSHYPRFLDFRWLPSSGEYPMSYEVEWATGQRGVNLNEWTYIARPVENTNIPYHVISFAGSNPGRLRVRAVNQKGTSVWSDYRHFEFTR